MDEITRSVLMEKAKQYPRHAITLSHQFLDGVTPHECGFVPDDWDGNMVKFTKGEGETFSFAKQPIA